MATNEILRFAETDTGTNLLTQSEYAADSQRPIGNQPGVARSKLVNKALRQASLISAGVAEFLADNQANNITDALTPQNIADYLQAAITGALGVTPPQFDNDTSLATTAFVQRALGNFAVGDSFAQDETLSAAKTGRHLLPNSNAITRVYLPSASAAGFTLGGRGEAYHIQNTASQAIAVAPQGSDSIFVSGSSSGAGVALSLPVGAEVTLVRISNTAWAAFGTGALKSSADFGASLAANGYQKLPSGLIIQWGFVPKPSAAAVAVTWPIAFPNGFGRCIASFGGSANPTNGVSTGSPGLTGATFYSAVGGAGYDISYAAIGW